MLAVGDRFVFFDARDGAEHEVTGDPDSHFEYDGRPNRRLSKDTLVKRVGKRDSGEALDRILDRLNMAVGRLQRDGDVSAWAGAVADILSRVTTHGMDDAAIPLEKLARLGDALFSKLRKRRGKDAVESLPTHDRKRWDAAVAGVEDALSRAAELAEGVQAIRDVVSEVIRKCGEEWCLYTKHAKDGKRRRLGTHSSRAGAERQERAIKTRGG